MIYIKKSDKLNVYKNLHNMNALLTVVPLPRCVTASEKIVPKCIMVFVFINVAFLDNIPMLQPIGYTKRLYCRYTI